MAWLTAVYALLWLAYASVAGGLIMALLRAWRWVRNCLVAAGLLGVAHALCALALALTFSWKPELIVGEVEPSALPALRRSMASAASVSLHSALIGAAIGLGALLLAWQAQRRLLTVRATSAHNQSLDARVSDGKA